MENHQLRLEEKQHVDKCFENAIRANSKLRERFADGLIKAHCVAHMKWNRDFLDSLARSAFKAVYKPKHLTPAQWGWISEIWHCKDSLCMCQMIGSCRKLIRAFQTESPSDITLLSENTTLSEQIPKFSTRKKRQNNWQNVNDMLRDRAGRVTRKEIRSLSENERATYHRALNRLKVELVDGISKYDLIIKHHTPEYSPEAHFCAAFLPFHRELLKNFEVSLRTIEPDMGLPYWDTTLDEPLPDPKDSILWSDLFFGNGFGDVTEGPFANWSTFYDVRLGHLSRNLRITRNLGVRPYSGLIKQTDLDEIMRYGSFRDFVYCKNPFFELVHGGAHLWIGGHMVELRVAPNDPLFFPFHCFVDLVWEEWRLAKQDRYRRETEYVPDNDACSAICHGNQQMRPFSITLMEGLSNSYTDNMYQYAPRPSCSYEDPNCHSLYLFCDTRQYRCMSKVKINGNCQGYEGTQICYQSQCRSGRCEPLPTTTTSTTTTVVFPPQPDTVWLPITVLALTDTRTFGSYAPALITSVDKWDGRRLKGQAAIVGQPAYYTGAAYVQISNPATSNRIVEATVEVQDPATGTSCQSMCLLDPKLGYEPCEPRIRLGERLNLNGVEVAANLEAAARLTWKDQQRIPTKFLFLCNPLSLDMNVPVKVLPPMAATMVQNVKPNQSRNTNCLNTHRCCAVWVADFNKCQSNQWFLRACPRSCNVCQGGVITEQDENCSDYSEQCPQWAAKNQCTQNLNWMEENCRRSCGTCDRSHATLAEICGTGPIMQNKSRCRDQHSDCPAWASLDECRKNPRWMLQNCPRSCNVC